MSSTTTGWCTTRPRRYLRGREREGVESELALTRDGGAAGRGAEQDNQILGTFELPGTFEVATVPAASYKLENVFEIMSKAGHYMVQAESAADRDEWIRVLRELSRQKGCVSLASSAPRPRWSSVKRVGCIRTRSQRQGAAVSACTGGGGPGSRGRRRAGRRGRPSVCHADADRLSRRHGGKSRIRPSCRLALLRLAHVRVRVPPIGPSRPLLTSASAFAPRRSARPAPRSHPRPPMRPADRPAPPLAHIRVRVCVPPIGPPRALLTSACAFCAPNVCSGPRCKAASASWAIATTRSRYASPPPQPIPTWFTR